MISLLLNFVCSFDIYFPQTAVAGHVLAIQSLGVVGLQLDAYVQQVRNSCIKAGVDEGFVARKTRWSAPPKERCVILLKQIADHSNKTNNFK